MKRCLVLAGGGAKGAYQMGFWKAIRELKIRFDMTCGTSVGALNAALIAQGDFDRGVMMWETLETDRIFSKEPRNIPKIIDAEAIAKSLEPVFGDWADQAVMVHTDASPLRETLESVLDEDLIRKSGIEVGIMATEYPVIKPAPLILSDIPRGKMMDYLMASSCLFPSEDPVEIGGQRYIDGGYADNAPINLALDMGADEIIVCDLHGSGVKLPYSTNKAVKTVSPHFPLGPTMDFCPETARRNVTLGYLDTMREFGVYDGYWYTFRQGEREEFLRKYAWSYASMLLTLRVVKNENESRRYYDIPVIRRIAEEEGERPGRMRYDFPMLIAEYAGEKFDLDPRRVYTEEKFSAQLLKSFRPYEKNWRKVEDTLDREIALNSRATILGTIEPLDIISFMVHRIRHFQDTMKERREHRIMMRLAPVEYFTAIFISKLKGYI